LQQNKQNQHKNGGESKTTVRLLRKPRKGNNHIQKSKMILVIHSNAGYCNKKKLRSQAGGHFFLSNKDKFPPNNGAIFTNAAIIKAVMASAAKVELGALYLNAKKLVYL
jgi:hypothetical protein